MVHRVLNAALGYEEVPSRDPEELHRLANNCNTQKYNAKIAGDDSSNLYFLQFVSAAKTLNMRAGVLGVFQYNFEVVLIETGHVIKVYYKVSFFWTLIGALFNFFNF
jgi:DIS3-like exonuclease 2